MKHLFSIIFHVSIHNSNQTIWQIQMQTRSTVATHYYSSITGEPDIGINLRPTLFLIIYLFQQLTDMKTNLICCHNNVQISQVKVYVVYVY